MRLLRAFTLIALVTAPAPLVGQVTTVETLKPGTPIRLTLAGGETVSPVLGTWPGTREGRLVIHPGGDYATVEDFERHLVRGLEVGERGRQWGIVGGLLGAVAGLMLAKGLSDDSCPADEGLDCLDGGHIAAAMLTTIIPIAVGHGLGYLLGHQFDRVKWTGVELPPVP